MLRFTHSDSLWQLARTRFCKAMLVLMLAVLTLQGLSATHHDHALIEQSADCTSCYMASHLPTPASPTSALTTATLLILLYCLFQRLTYRTAARQIHLTHPPRAPPDSTSTR
jgi:hypothetical protein